MKFIIQLNGHKNTLLIIALPFLHSILIIPDSFNRFDSLGNLNIARKSNVVRTFTLFHYEEYTKTEFSHRKTKI